MVLVRDECCAANEVSEGRAWPLVLAGAAFLYLWWIAALVFDITVVWHHFIKREAYLRRLEETQQEPVE